MKLINDQNIQEENWMLCEGSKRSKRNISDDKTEIVFIFDYKVYTKENGWR